MPPRAAAARSDDGPTVAGTVRMDFFAAGRTTRGAMTTPMTPRRRARGASTDVGVEDATRAGAFREHGVQYARSS